ncbi:oxidoreductase [Pedobacter foliorum]|uniref:oxidoreductase n=1 Tax=Pedobacter foliorum TaxID=2739058 RepID=UPI001566B945|nr:oxidoreductase [Pedobacter foliorum]NRF39074.1 oxidoreductase [Pedobacter foliorum]
MTKKAILLGASGLIGKNLLTQLLNNPGYTEVLAIGRRTLNMEHPKLKELIVDFDHIDQYASNIKGDVVFCCLGSTNSKTPDKVQYKKIDYQYPLDVGSIAQNNGATSYHLVSAIGADVNSSIFYPKTKGEVERDLKAIPFKSIYIYRPSFLDGNREEKRTAEKIMIVLMRFLNPLLIGGLKKYRSIKIETVASAMLKESLTDKKGVFIYSSDQIEALG